MNVAPNKSPIKIIKEVHLVVRILEIYILMLIVS